MKPLDKESVSTPIKRDEKRVGAPDEVKGNEIEILWPTEREIQEGEYAKPQWERKQVNVRTKFFEKQNDFNLLVFSIFGMVMITMINSEMRLK